MSSDLAQFKSVTAGPSCPYEAKQVQTMTQPPEVALYVVTTKSQFVYLLNPLIQPPYVVEGPLTFRNLCMLALVDENNIFFPSFSHNVFHCKLSSSLMSLNNSF
ncbi:hypothetical protein ILYODFUR_011513 [Ilyodon furcidens]|uniref:Uncharacterized protein n=1 Tax=Ilyodon furcidens TaxID=33524 RepID=A0ABV0U8S1_9TELE